MAEAEQEQKSKKLTKKEFEKKVLELAKQGYTAEKIGEQLRQQDIHPAEYDKKIGRVLKENEMFRDPTLKGLEEKFERVDNHSKKNRQDKRAKIEKTRLFARVRRLKKYRGLLKKKR